MILLLPAAVFAALYVTSRRRDVRRLRNGVFLVAAAACVLLAVAVEASRATPFLESLVLLGVVAGLGLIAILAVFLIGNGVTMLRLEGHSLGNLLSLVAGVAILVFPVLAAVPAFGLDRPTRLPGWATILLIGLGLLLLFACGYAAATFTAFAVYSLVYSRYRHTDRPAALVVLGSGLIRGEVPPLLRSRLDKALAVYRSVPDDAIRPILIPSGGQGSDEPRAEGDAMAEYLLAHGAASEDVHPETASRNTRENLLRSLEVQRAAGRSGSTLVVTNNYHVLRAALLARSVASDAQVIGSPTAAYYIPSAFLREYTAIMVEHKRLNAAALLTVAALVTLAAVWSVIPR
ncbi:vancomycin permeability regulator SanA [Curtobacterium sp. PhB25]|uniref:YdcF family protein n=1 Tax=Curtobacterium sp. PhB25 TaxID=2485205 RepID=UPI001066BC37|nr:YdcF family protein [Curtobacterium sp. PhB25]TDW63516.1 vancomycin permeability regulator SanA [Curtobacterium sp. PhB25]